MTITTPARRTATGRLPVFDRDGRIIATVDAARSRWMGTLLAQCDLHHVYLLDADDPWVGCPICNEAA